jgi:hypothetical protein
MVHAGWSQEAINRIQRGGLEHFDQVYGDSKYYWRATDRKMPHNLYTSLDQIRKGMQDRNMRLRWEGHPLTFTGATAVSGGAGEAGGAGTAANGAAVDSVAAASVPGASKVSNVTIPYLHGYEVDYRYDAASGRLLRGMNGQPHLDKETGRQLTADNVLIAEAKHRIVDDAGRRDIDVYGPGTGWLLQRDELRPITWERRGGEIRAFADGRELALLPGHTWVQVVPEGTKLRVTP